MGKKLSEMTLEELWQLFPIYLAEHREDWHVWYYAEEASLRGLIPQAVRMSHVGSTAVCGIWAKPIIDILVELPRDDDMSGVCNMLEQHGYICMSRDDKRISLNKGYTENGFAERVFHLHLRYADDNDELYFRDYLMAYPDIAAEYERLKLALWKQYEHDRDGYTHAKGELVARYTTLSKEQKQQPIPAVE